MTVLRITLQVLKIIQLLLIEDVVISDVFQQKDVFEQKQRWLREGLKGP